MFSRHANIMEMDASCRYTSSGSMLNTINSVFVACLLNKYSIREDYPNPITKFYNAEMWPKALFTSLYILRLYNCIYPKWRRYCASDKSFYEKQCIEWYVDHLRNNNLYASNYCNIRHVLQYQRESYFMMAAQIISNRGLIVLLIRMEW